MKSSLYFGIKLEKRALLYKLESNPEISKEHPKIKITQNNNKNKKQQSKIQNEQREKTKQIKMLSQISKGNSQYPKFSPR